MDKRKLITKTEPTATGEQVAWNEDQDGNVVTGWMPVSDAKEIARRWNMHEDLMDLCETVKRGNTEYDDLEAMAKAIIEKHNPNN
jgi:hypothetical protein